MTKLKIDQILLLIKSIILMNKEVNKDLVEKKNIKFKKVKQGRFFFQYGIKFPILLIPVKKIIITATK